MTLKCELDQTDSEQIELNFCDIPPCSNKERFLHAEYQLFKAVFATLVKRLFPGWKVQ
jgi:hypothetical protein